MIDYYDPDGNPITMEAWSALFEKRGQDADRSWWQETTDISEGVFVSTVWLGLDHSFGGGPPLTWETMVFGGEYDGEQWRHSSRAEAFEDHGRIVAALRKDEDPTA